MIHHGDCVEVMAGMEAGSIDAIVTDPPYGLGFMGKAWDHGAPGVPFWAEMLRVAKPSAYLLAFGGTRTVHRIATSIEDAGWIIRDMLVWAYASGFPKSKASLKPAWEPVVMARKPGPLRELNIDATRIGTGGDKGEWPITDRAVVHEVYGARIEPALTDNGKGRWPANLILTDPIFDGDTPGVVGGGDAGQAGVAGPGSGGWGKWLQDGDANGSPMTYGDSGTYSRFFLIPKSSRSDREPVLRGQLPMVEQNAVGPSTVTAAEWDDPEQKRYERHSVRSNVHPTVKPIDLMRHLVRLVTPPGGTVLDPFLGSGTTAIAAEMEGFAWIGIEKEPEYVAIAEARLNGTQKGMAL